MPLIVFCSVILNKVPGLFFDFFNTYLANIFPFKRGQGLFRSAEQAGFVVFCKYNFVPVNIDFNRIGATYIHFGAHFLGDHDASKLINVSDNTCGFQCFNLSGMKTLPTSVAR